MDPIHFDLLILTTALLIALACGFLWMLILTPLIGCSWAIFLTTALAALFVLLLMAAE